MFKSSLCEIMTATNDLEKYVLFHIPDKCMVSEAPVCLTLAASYEHDTENDGNSANHVDANLEQALLMPFGADNPRKIRGGKLL